MNQLCPQRWFDRAKTKTSRKKPINACREQQNESKFDQFSSEENLKTKSRYRENLQQQRWKLKINN